MNPPRCFLIEPMIKHCDSERLLQQYGPVVYLFKHEESRPSVFDARFAEETANRLDDAMYNVATDYIVIGGSINAAAQLLAVAVDEFRTDKYKTIRTLMYSPEDRRYISVCVGG